MEHHTLTSGTYHVGISELAGQDPDLAGVLSRWGTPPFWTQAPGFPGLVHAILAQQVSLESVQSTYGKLEQAVKSVSPEKFLKLDDNELKVIGFSRQKTSYVRGLAREIVEGRIELDTLESLENDEVRKRLTKVRGIGPWTADTYMLFSLCRPDAWPSGDLALITAIRELKGWADLPDFREADRIADQWRPWRAVAARILWHYYLCERGRDGTNNQD